MPRDGSNIYSKPPGTSAVSGDTISSSKFNSTVDDIVSDLNLPRPISAGGTGATSASDARTNLGVDPIGLIPIATATADGDATIEFTDFDATKYYGYKFFLMNVRPVTDDVNLSAVVSTDGGTTFITNDNVYSGVEVDTSGTVTGRGNSATTNMIVARAAKTGQGGVNGEVTLHSPDVDEKTHITFQTSYQTSNATSFYGAGRTDDATIANAIRFAFSSGNIDSGTIAMYGMAR